jgi:hypothetical protein
MDETRTPLHTGGCQCGRVRYALAVVPHDISVCHCRMCQKAVGSFFAPLGGMMLEDFAWTRGEPAIFRSSSIVERGFCAHCGTPLSYRNLENPWISISLGSLDQPERVKPQIQYGNEGRLPLVSDLHELPGEATTESEGTPEDMAKRASRQHPDHDTDRWVPKA